MKIYVNIVFMWWDGGIPQWVVCWHDQWLSASIRAEAIKKRKKFLIYLRRCNIRWRPRHLKTICVKIP